MTFASIKSKKIMQSINQHAAVKCAKQILIDARPELVWNVLTNIAKWPGWNKDISYTKLNGSLQPGTSFDWKTGGTKIRSVLHTVDPHKHFGWTGKTLGIFAVHNWTLAEENRKTRVTVEESMEGFLASIFRGSFNKMLEKGMLSWLEMLKQECEK